MLIRNFSHVGLSVADIERSVNFYRGVFGFVRSKRVLSVASPSPSERLLGAKPLDAKIAFIRRDDLIVELLEFKAPAPVPQEGLRPLYHNGLVHLCFKVVDVDSVMSAVERFGGKVHHETRLQGDEDGQVFDNVMCSDPDGTRVELSGLPPLTDGMEWEGAAG
jgi:catechol 2,3-dioxygenase-like lactoylglutathione lyase family enzyme